MEKDIHCAWVPLFSGWELLSIRPGVPWKGEPLQKLHLGWVFAKFEVETQLLCKQLLVDTLNKTKKQKTKQHYSSITPTAPLQRNLCNQHQFLHPLKILQCKQSWSVLSRLSAWDLCICFFSFLSSICFSSLIPASCLPLPEVVLSVFPLH